MSASNETREEYRALLRRRRILEGEIERLREPFMPELARIEDRLEEISDGADCVGQCETCGVLIFDGDQYCPCSAGAMLCEDHAAMLSDVAEQYRECIADGWVPENFDTMDEVRESLATIEADIAKDGDRKLLVTA